MPETQALIARLQRKIAAQERTIETLMDTAEQRQAGTEATQFQVWRQNVQLEEVLNRKTKILEQGLSENQSLNRSLQDSQQFLNAVIDTVPSKICITDKQGVVTKVNRGWSENLPAGARAPVVGESLVQYYASAFSEANIDSNLSESLARIISRSLDHYTEQTQFGSHFYQTEVALIPKSTNVLVAHTDISVLVTTQHALEDERIQNQMLSLVAKHTTSGILIMDVDGNVEWSNGAFEDLSGVDAAGLNGFELVSNLVTSADQITLMHQHLAERRDYLADVQIRTVQGDVRHVNLEFRPSGVVGGQQKLIAVVIDIEERIQNQLTLARERRVLENVLANVPHGIYWKDVHGVYQGCNDAYVQLLYLQDRSELIGNTDDVLDLAEHSVATQNRNEQLAVQTGEPVPDVEVQCVAGPTVKHLLASRVPLKDENGSVSGVLGIFADITSVKAMENELNQARRLEAIGQLSAGIAHEINTPMQYIGDNIQFLERATSLLIQLGEEVEKLGKDLDDADLREMIGNWLRVGRFDQLRSRVPSAITSAKEGVVVVSQIVQAMKAFAHPGDRESKVADLNAAIANTITVSRNEWKYVAEIDTEFAESCSVRCNLGELNQVFLNIIVNAAHAISDTLNQDRRLGRIRISTHDDPGHVEIRISDDGTGMDAAVQARIFEQFFTTKSVGTGTGQGLALAHAVVVDRHKGTISVDSTPGRGTTFRIRIPKSVDDEEAG